MPGKLNIARRDDERGLALITVMVATMVLALFATTLVAYATSSQNISRHDQDWNAALAGAEAGIDDYIFRLNENDLYYTYDPDPDPDTPIPPDGNEAFTRWVPVAGSSSTETSYRYSINRARLNNEGVLEITSSGRVRDTTRTVTATLRRRRVLDYLYFTEFETKDPALYTGSGEFSTATADARCSFHYFGDYVPGQPQRRRDVRSRVDYDGDTDSSDAQYCSDINFASRDTIRGPLHTNDAFLVCGTPKFRGPTTTGFPRPGEGGRMYRPNTWTSSCGTNNPEFVGNDPNYATGIELPPTAGELRQYVQPYTPTNQAGGCLYTGPTRIRLNADGTMTVKSPYSKQTNNDCPVYGTAAQPRNGVIYVQNVPTPPASGPADANAWSTSCPRSQYTGSPRRWNPVSGSPTPQWTSPAHPLGYGNPGTTGANIDRNASYGCRNGDVFLEGTLDGQLTIGAQNNIVVIGNTTYESGTEAIPGDLLGLIAEQFVEVYHPVDCLTSDRACEMDADIPARARFDTPGLPSNEPDSSWNRGVFRDPVIHGAILSLRHSFRVQQYNYGDIDELGGLHVVGAIGQRYRGIVGLVDSTGYAKDYVYDDRFKHLSPPKFLDPVRVAWGVATWAEVDTPDGL